MENDKFKEVDSYGKEEDICDIILFGYKKDWHTAKECLREFDPVYLANLRKKE